ncbi:MAG: tetratricopeptide repeat protein [Acidobacteria bacterium]|nr:tetratricopeptide repeat protein [Acidobacteriota bacterium]
MVLSLSDLQWADDVVLRLVSGLMARLARTPLVIIASTTHELFERWSPQPGRSNMLLLALDSLDAQQGTALVRQIVGDDLDDFTVAEIVDRGGGNPFFLEELAELVAADDNADIAAVPHNVRGVISARLDNIPVSDRQLLEHAAVLGRRGPVDGLRKMAEVMQQGGFDESVQRLTESDLLRVDRERWEFPSNLLHEVVYARLAKSERARRHAGVAAYLEEHGGALPEAIAGHYRRAASLDRDLRSVEGVPDDVADRAIATTRAVVGTRRAAAATRRNVEALTEVLEVAPVGHPQRELLRVDRARVLVLARELELANEDLDAVFAVKKLDNAVRAAAELVLGELLQIRGEFEQSIEMLGSANKRFEDLGDHVGAAQSTRLSGMSMLYQGDTVGAEEMLNRALELSVECQDLGGEAWVRQNLAWMSFTRGRITEAKERIDEAIALFAEIGDGVGITWGRGLLAYVHLYEGDLEGAAVLAADVLAEAEEQGEKWGKGMMLVLLGSVALWSGDPFEAVNRAEEAVALFGEIEDALALMQAEAVLGRAYVRAGRVQEARALFTRTIDALTSAPREGTAELVPTSAAAAMVTLGDPEAAHLYLEALDQSDDDVGNLGSSERLVATAMVALQRGDAAGAVSQLQEVIDATGELRVDTSANASLALAAVAAGEIGRARRHSAIVSESVNASYPDRMFAIIAQVLCDALDRDDDAFDLSLTELRRMRRAGEDQMTRMLSLMAESAALAAIGHADATAREEELQALLSQLGIEPSGWRRVFADALAVT